MNTLLCFWVPNAVHDFHLDGASWSLSCLPSTICYVTEIQICKVRSVQDLTAHVLQPHCLGDHVGQLATGYIYIDDRATPHNCLLYYAPAHPPLTHSVASWVSGNHQQTLDRKLIILVEQISNIIHLIDYK